MQVQNLTGKIAFVQGGSRGIGAAIAQRLAKQGATVVLSYVSSPDKANAVVAAIEAAGGKAQAVQADSANVSALQAAIRNAAKEHGRIDILVNNAGVLAMGPVDDFKLEDFDRTLDVNVRSVFVATQEAVRYMGNGGRVINIGSVNADRIPFAGGAAYAMSKAAVAGLTKGLARDLGPRGITVNNVQPGPVDTDMNPDGSDFSGALKSLMAIGRYGTTEEIAGFVAYLAGPEAGYVTGASLTVDGGFGA
jgi:3-oxoacyl-[acyl-carrier protein] reductase